MKFSKWIWIAIALIIVLALGTWWYAHRTPAPAPNPFEVRPTQTTTTNISSSSSGTQAVPMTATVTYTDSGFSPASITVAQGGTVTFVNNSDNSMWVASDPYPTSSAYDDTDLVTHCGADYTGALPFDECTAVPVGGTFVFTFGKSGSWGYQNHAMPSDTGTVIVQ